MGLMQDRPRRVGKKDILSSWPGGRLMNPTTLGSSQRSMRYQGENEPRIDNRGRAQAQAAHCDYEHTHSPGALMGSRSDIIWLWLQLL